MGDPRKHRKKYSRPKKMWDKPRLEEEVSLYKEYGTSNKREIYKMRSLLKKFALQAKRLLSSSTQQSEQEKKSLLRKLHSLALIGANAQLDDVLALQLNNIMERRLQTLVLRKGLANTIKQARQMIVHQHIKAGNKPITSPSYIVSKEEESKLAFAEKSPFVKEGHPERPEQIKKLKEAPKRKTAEVKEAKEEIKEEKIQKKEEKTEAKEQGKIQKEEKAEQKKEIKEELQKEEKTEHKKEIEEEKIIQKIKEEKAESKKIHEQPVEIKKLEMQEEAK